MEDNFVVVDIETKNSFMSIGGYDPAKLNISLVGLYTSWDDQFTSFLDNELEHLWPKLEKADRVVGFNVLGFDYPVMQKYYRGDVARWPTLDMLAEFKKDHGFRIKLDSLAGETLGVHKSGDGLKAIRLWEQGKIDELKQYCLDDVKITRDLFICGRDNGVLYYPDKGIRTTWMVDWAYKPPTQVAITLPF